LARKILLADDSVTAQNMGRKILTDAGYDVVTVNNGSAALKRVGEHKPDLIVLDVYMPGYSGLEVCARLKDAPDTARIPVLLTVGKLEPFKPEEASRVRADAFIVKPFEASELLSALTRLEDRMVPQADGGRFSTTVSGIERFSGDPAMRKVEADPEETGWKNRLRFPSKKKKEEPEPAPEEDFGTTPYRDFKKGSSKAPARGSFPVSGTPAAQEPGLVPDIPRDITPEELDALSELVAKLDGPIPAAENIAPLGEQIASAEAAPVETKQEESKQEEVHHEAAPTVEVAHVGEPEAVVADGVVEAPPTVAEPVAEAAPAAAATEVTPASEEAMPAAQEPEIPAPVEAVAVEVAPEQASIDKSEEPGFAAVSSVEEVASQAPREFQVVASADAGAIAEPVKAEADTVHSERQEIVETPAVEANPEPAPVAESTPVPGEAAAPTPSPEELAEALRLLTPSQAGQTLAEAGAALAEELGRVPAAGSRWVAETVALSAEEASVSLEAEMFKTFATRPDEVVAIADQAASESVGHDEEEAAEAAVEAAEAVAETSAQTSPVEVAREHPAEVTASADVASVEEAQEISPARRAEEATPEEVEAVTFADAIRNQEENVSSSSAVEVSSSEHGAGEDDMAKDAKGKGKWHQIHSTPEAAAKTDVVEAAKQSEEAPKAMAAAAASDGSSEASAIASIVDSVLADLRPKIVEEIAKKLAKK